MANPYDTTVGQQIEFHLPSWYVSPGPRLERARQLNEQREWGFMDSDFPSVPGDPDKLWLLAVNLPDKGETKGLERTFNDRRDLIVPPVGYTKWSSTEIKTDPDHLRLVDGYRHVPGVRFVEFFPNSYQNESPQAALERSQGDLCGTEVLDAVCQFPDWPLSWFKNGMPAPNLSALRYKWGKSSDWLSVLHLNRWDGGRKLELRDRWPGYRHFRWSSPSVSQGVLTRF